MYRTIDAAFWTDPKVRQLTPDGKLLLLYFITNPHTHVSGIYILPAVIVQHETGMVKRTLDTLCDTLSRLGFCTFDSDLEVIWVRKMMFYQGRGEKNSRSAAAHIAEDLHNSKLCNEFLEVYPDVRQYVKVGFLHTLSHRVSELRTPDLRSQISDNRIQSPDLGEEVPRKRGQKTSVPESLPISTEMYRLASELGIADVKSETDAMLDHFRGNGQMKADWQAAWRNWMRNSLRFSKNGNGGSYGKSKTDINRENAERLRARLDSEDSGSGFGGDF